MSLFELAPGGACPAAGHPAVARGPLPHVFTLACASSRGHLSDPGPRRPSAVWFLLRFPSGCPGSPLATSLPFGARTFLPRSDFSAGDPPSASGMRERSEFEELREGLRARGKFPKGFYENIY